MDTERLNGQKKLQRKQEIVVPEAVPCIERLVEIVNQENLLGDAALFFTCDPLAGADDEVGKRYSSVMIHSSSPRKGPFDEVDGFINVYLKKTIKCLNIPLKIGLTDQLSESDISDIFRAVLKNQNPYKIIYQKGVILNPPTPWSNIIEAIRSLSQSD